MSRMPWTVPTNKPGRGHASRIGWCARGGGALVGGGGGHRSPRAVSSRPTPRARTADGLTDRGRDPADVWPVRGSAASRTRRAWRVSSCPRTAPIRSTSDRTSVLRGTARTYSPWRTC